jgi:hypothetical protein
MRIERQFDWFERPTVSIYADWYEPDEALITFSYGHEGSDQIASITFLFKPLFPKLHDRLMVWSERRRKRRWERWKSRCRY